ncbi:Hypothetical protein A7982_00297 [Minicystis rosea]|nr:Hypothetical protein A7982_00297 [Minicystis rosea]
MERHAQVAVRVDGASKEIDRSATRIERCSMRATSVTRAS